MSGSVGVQRADDTEIVGEARQVRKQAADLKPALPVAAKRERRLHQMADGPAIGADRRVATIRHVVEPRQRRLGIKRIDLAGPAVHEQEDGMLGLHREVRPACLIAVARRREEAIAAQEIDERQAREAAADLPKELPARAAAGSAVWREAIKDRHRLTSVGNRRAYRIIL